MSLLLAVLVLAASAQDGGKVAWRGKGSDDPTAALSELKKQGKPIVLLFSSQGDAQSKALSDGPLSDPKVVRATELVSCVFVECKGGRANAELCGKYRVSGWPVILFCDPTGKALGELTARDPAEMAKAFDQLVARYKADAPNPRAVADGSLELRALSVGEAIAIGRKNKQLAVLFFYDDSPGSESVLAALTDPALKPYQARFSLGAEKYTKGAGLSSTFEVTRAPTVLIVDPATPKPHERPLSRTEGSRSARELIRELDRILESLPKSLPGGPAVNPGPGPLPKAPEEKLSDDQVERLFIQARLTVAQDLMKKSQKAKAIEIYEDLIKTYPKHVDIVDVRKLLEEARK